MTEEETNCGARSEEWNSKEKPLLVQVKLLFCGVNCLQNKNDNCCNGKNPHKVKDFFLNIDTDEP